MVEKIKATIRHKFKFDNKKDIQNQISDWFNLPGPWISSYWYVYLIRYGVTEEDYTPLISFLFQSI